MEGGRHTPATPEALHVGTAPEPSSCLSPASPFLLSPFFWFILGLQWFLRTRLWVWSDSENKMCKSWGWASPMTGSSEWKDVKTWEVDRELSSEMLCPDKGHRKPEPSLVWQSSPSRISLTQDAPRCWASPQPRMKQAMRVPNTEQLSWPGPKPEGTSMPALHLTPTEGEKEPTEAPCENSEQDGRALGTEAQARLGWHKTTSFWNATEEPEASKSPDISWPLSLGAPSPVKPKPWVTQICLYLTRSMTIVWCPLPPVLQDFLLRVLGSYLKAADNNNNNNNEKENKGLHWSYLTIFQCSTETDHRVTLSCSFLFCNMKTLVEQDEMI